mgnify:FL=1
MAVKQSYGAVLLGKEIHMNEMSIKGFVQPAYSAAALQFLARNPRLSTNNKWVDSSHDVAIDVEDT